VRQGYLDLAAAEPKRFFVVDARQSIEEMAALIRARVDELLK
jgi:dTMP kinase